MYQTIFEPRNIESTLAEYETTFVDIGFGGFFKSRYYDNYLCRLSLDRAYDIQTGQFVKVGQGESVRAFLILRLNDIVLSDLWGKLESIKQGDAIGEPFLVFDALSTYVDVAQWLSTVLGDKPKDDAENKTTELISKYQSGLGVLTLALAISIQRHLGFPVVLLYQLGTNDLVHVANLYGNRLLDISGVVPVQELNEIFNAELTYDIDTVDIAISHQKNLESVQQLLDEHLGNNVQDREKAKEALLADVWYDCKQKVFAELLKDLGEDFGDHQENNINKLNQLLFVLQSKHSN